MKKKFIRAIFPGSFDPITNGHLDVIERSRKLFDELIVAVGRSPIKNPLFTPEERVEMVTELVKNMPGVSVESYDGLTVEYTSRKKADVILRGLRSVSDFHYEVTLAMTNRSIAGIETVFIMADAKNGFTSSTLIRDIASMGGDISHMVPSIVSKRLQRKLGEKK